MEKLEVMFRIVTPLFLGGAEPNIQAELRPPSIKGAMRYWYRAIDPEYKKHEAKFFGGTEKGQGQASFLLSIARPLRGNTSYSKGIQYFSFPFNMGGNERKYIQENQEFTLCLLFRKESSPKLRRTILASLWLLGHVGGLGSRSRRGFGTVALVDWETDCYWPEMERLASAHHQTSVQDWKTSFHANLKVIKDWFPNQPAGGHLTLGNKTVFHLLTNEGQGFMSWDAALSQAAGIMQRSRDHQKPDYLHVKAHMCKNDFEARKTAPDIIPAHLSRAPDRTAFGLPLTFRSSSLKYDIEVQGKTKKKYPSTIFEALEKNETRSGSRVFVRVIRIGNKFYPLFCRFNGDLLSPGNKITDGYDKNGKGYAAPPDQILDDFMNTLPKGEIIQW